MTILSMLTEVLQATGAGMFTKATIDLTTDTPTSSYDFAAAVLGASLWVGGLLLERKIDSRRNLPLDADPDDEEPKKSKFLKKGLTYSAGYGIVASLTQIGKHVDTPSANIALLSSGVIAGLALSELRSTQSGLYAPYISWEKTRLLCTFLADVLLVSSMKHAVNGNPFDAYDVAAVVLGLGITIGESIFSYKYDQKLSLKSAISRRLMKASLSTVLIALEDDIVSGNFPSKYPVADDTYLLINNALLVVDFLCLRELGKLKNNLHNAYLNEILYSEEFETSNQAEVGYHETNINSPVQNNLLIQNSVFSPKKIFTSETALSTQIKEEKIRP